MKKYITAAAIAAGYIILCRIARGYWALAGDAIVIIMAAAVWAALKTGLRRDSGVEEADEPMPTPIRIAKASGGISRSERCAK